MMQHRMKFNALAALAQRYYLLLLFSVVMLITNLVLSFGVLHALKHQRREIIPFGASSGYVVSDSTVDGYYLDLMTQNFIYSRLNIKPENVIKQHQRLLHYVDSAIHADFKKQLKREADLIEDKKISSSFDIEALHSDVDSMTSIVRGVLHRHVGYRALPEQQKTYQLRYRYRIGQLHLISFTEVVEKEHE